jgi:hypothetical protein
MEALREIRKVKNGEITIKVPDHFNETEVEVLILPLNRDKDEKLEDDVLEALKEVKMMREGKLPEKSARNLLSEL